jgi:methionine-rich copper-binding protein CopC
MKPWPAILLIFMAQPAFAHAMLEHATPAAGASVRAPKELVLQYSEALEPTFSSAEVHAADGTLMSNPPTISDTTMRLTLKPLAPGQYKVIWRAISVDTHRTDGSYTFTVKP